MRFVADFHIHSHYSRATSKLLVPEQLVFWARIKGIQVMGTGDCIHPGWLSELKEKCAPVGNGLFRLKPEFEIKNHYQALQDPQKEVYLMLTAEISCIYKKNGKVRKVHHIALFPSFEAVERVQAVLNQIGNIKSDGRPILGLDSKHLLEIILESAPYSFMIPAHIWTPWFSVLGSKSGFDSLEECFDELTPHIFAVETGLSSDPPMNRVCSILDQVRLVSNSDAHSLEKLGREANWFDTELSFNGIYNALKNDDGFLGTIEFFPQEGKYHYDGHRKCNIMFDPLETLSHHGICPKCQKPLTLGVMYRVAELADRDRNAILYGKQSFHSITPLGLLLAELNQTKSAQSASVQRLYTQLINQIGSEFDILLSTPIDQIKKSGISMLGEGISRLREGHVFIEEGYDGEFGRIKVFDPQELKQSHRGVLFGPHPVSRPEKRHSIEFDIPAFQREKLTAPAPLKLTPQPPLFGQGQKEGELIGIEMIMAGPGSGKTHLLTQRIIGLLKAGVSGESIYAITFANKAAEEIRNRICKVKPDHKVNISTFHRLGLTMLQRFYTFQLIDEAEKIDIVGQLVQEKKQIKSVAKLISSVKQGITPVQECSAFSAYEAYLDSHQLMDLDDLIAKPVELLKKEDAFRAEIQQKIQYLFVDEFQDINARQYEWIRLLTDKKDPNLLVIGDPDQAIYGFRGSDVKYMQQFKQDYPGAKISHLKTSYRCPQIILNVAANVLEKPPQLQGRSDTIHAQINAFDSDRREAIGIAHQIEKLMGGIHSLSIDSGLSEGDSSDQINSFSDIAILCRTTYMFDVLVHAMSTQSIPFQVIGSAPFYTQSPYREALQKWNLDDRLEKRSILSIMESLLPDYKIPLLHRQHFQKLSTEYGTDYQRFLTDLKLRQSVDELDYNIEAVSLMTMHAAKGLTFKAVFIPGCENKLIPFEWFTSKTEAELAEEARLFYVAITRSAKYLYLSYAKHRTLKGRNMSFDRSPFLDRIESILVQFNPEKISVKPKDHQLALF